MVAGAGRGYSYSHPPPTFLPTNAVLPMTQKEKEIVALAHRLLKEGEWVQGTDDFRVPGELRDRLAVQLERNLK